MGTKLLKRVSDFLASLPGLPIVIAIVLVVLGFLLQLLPADWPVVGWLARTHLLLYLGVILGFVGALLRGAL
jgi:hypothetical protein